MHLRASQCCKAYLPVRQTECNFCLSAYCLAEGTSCKTEVESQSTNRGSSSSGTDMAFEQTPSTSKAQPPSHVERASQPHNCSTSPESHLQSKVAIATSLSFTDLLDENKPMHPVIGSDSILALMDQSMI